MVRVIKHPSLFCGYSEPNYDLIMLSSSKFWSSINTQFCICGKKTSWFLLLFIRTMKKQRSATMHCVTHNCF